MDASVRPVTLALIPDRPIDRREASEPGGLFLFACVSTVCGKQWGSAIMVIA